MTTKHNHHSGTGMNGCFTTNAAQSGGQSRVCRELLSFESQLLSWVFVGTEKSQTVSVCQMPSVLAVETNTKQTLWRVPKCQKAEILLTCNTCGRSPVLIYNVHCYSSSHDGSLLSANQGQMLVSWLFIHSRRVWDQWMVKNIQPDELIWFGQN